MNLNEQKLCNLSFIPPANKLWGKVIFVHLFVILFTGGSMWAGTPPSTRYTNPPGQGTPLSTRYTPQTRYPPRPGTPTRDQVHPPARACWEIRSMRGQYASYWNAILFTELNYENFIVSCWDIIKTFHYNFKFTRY